MPKPEIVESNTIKIFIQPRSQSYPEIHLEDSGAALILYVSPLPQEGEEGTIVVANFSERDSNLIMRTLSKMYDNMSGIVNIRIVAPNETNDVAKNIQELLMYPAYQTHIKNMRLTDALKKIKIETAKDFTLQFLSGPGLSLTSLVTQTSTPPASKSSPFSSLGEAIRATFLRSPTKERPANNVDSEPIEPAYKNKPDSPPKRV